MIIALSGWRRSGKDTIANYLVEEHAFTRISFADRLKELVAQQYDLPLSYMHDVDRKEMPLHQYPVIPGDSFSEKIQSLLSVELKSGFWTPRALCILEGSIKRSVYSNYWVRSAISSVLANPQGNYVISDMRYKSEADTLKLFLPDTVTVRVNRWESIETQDPSERDLDAYTFTHQLQNTGTREELYAQVSSSLSLSTRSIAEHPIYIVEMPRS